MLYSYSVPKRQICHFFFVNRNEFIVPYCLRQYLGLAARCRRHDFLPMMNNLFVKFRMMAIKIKKDDVLKTSILTVGLIVAPWKFDVLKTSIFSLEASLLGQIFV